MRRRFRGQVAIVTGGARGIGAATVRRLAQEGAAVLVTDILDEPGGALAEEIRRAEGRAVYEHLDVSSEAEWKRAIDRAATMGRVTVLVNNAAIARLEGLEAETKEGYDQLHIRVNSVHPGFVDTPMLAPFLDRAPRGPLTHGDAPPAEAMRDYIATTTPMGRMGKPEEIAAAIAFLASEDASYVTGSELYLDGGFTAW